MFRYLRILCVLLFVTSAALSVNADTVTYTFESPQFTVGQTTPLLNIAPNTGSPTFLASFTSSPFAGGFRIDFFQPNPLFTGNLLYDPSVFPVDTLTISFNTPVESVQFAFAINEFPSGPPGGPGQITLTSPVGSQTQTAGNVGGPFLGGTFSFSSPTPFTTLQLRGFSSFGQRVAFAIDNLTLTTQVIPEPTTLVLLGTGLAGVGAAARKRRKTTKSEDA